MALISGEQWVMLFRLSSWKMLATANVDAAL